MLAVRVPISDFKTGKISQSSIANDSSFALTALSETSSDDLMQSLLSFFSKSAVETKATYEKPRSNTDYSKSTLLSTRKI